MKYTRNSKEGMRRCVKCDTECTGTYFCHAGLMDFAADIVVEGEKVGAIIGGQVLPAQCYGDEFRIIAAERYIDGDAFIQEIGQVRVRSEKSIRAAASLLADVMNRVVNLEYMKYRNNKRLNIFDEELDHAISTVIEINKKTKELEGIATKQNILSLNASIESARAGVAGAGFAVVAKQMGELATQSAGIYKEISDAASDIQQAVRRMSQKHAME